MRFLTSRRPLTVLLALVASASLGYARNSARADERVDFNREVRPILARNCFKCHGPDDKTREASLRLDTAEGATAKLESGQRAIVPKNAAASELVARIDSTDPDLVMPPPTTKKSLTAAERSILKRWIEAGAIYEPHWAFLPPKQLPIPVVSQPAWLRSPLDGHVLRTIDSHRLRPAPEADRATLLRRAYLDLVGFPPTVDEAEEFLRDDAPDAYERLIDRLLASPHYGQRWARRWLDLARYADTNGYEKDRPRSMWPYRDWVIKALNSDRPFDQFTIDQIAGDMLPQASLEQRVATGFHRNTMINEEGGIDPLEFRYYAMVDRVNTTGTTWLGLTLACANCHTHKYDPIPHQEYYQFFAMLNNADELELDVPLGDDAQRRAELDRRIAERESQLESQFPPAGEVAWTVAQPKTAVATSGATTKTLEDHSVLIGGEVSDRDRYTVTFEARGEPISSLRLEALTDPSLGSSGPGRTAHGNFVLTEIKIQVESLADNSSKQTIRIATGAADVEQPMFPIDQAFDGKPETGWAVHHPQQPLNVARTATFRLAEPVRVDAGTRWTITLDHQYGGRHTLGRFRLSVGRDIKDARPLAERRRDHLERRFQDWLASQSAHASRWTVLQPRATRSNLPFLTVLDDQSVRASGDQSKSDWYELDFELPNRPVTAIRLEALVDDESPKHGPGRVYYEGPHGDFWLSDVKVQSGPALDGGPRSPRKLGRASQSFAAANSSAAAAIDDNLQTGWSINGGQGRPHVAVFNLSEPIVGDRALVVRLLFERYYAAGLGRFRISVTDDPDAAASTLPPEVESALATPAAERSSAQVERLKRHFLSIAPELAAARAEIDSLKAQRDAVPTSLVFQERPDQFPRPTHRYHRGEFLQPKEQVQPEVLKLLPPLAPQTARNRLELARWLVSPANPLVGRVTMNRHWAAFFGRGLVRTTEDFGYQGEAPANPALLDWLAVEFVRVGWSTKAMHRTIATSSTYRQDSAVSPELLERDPYNEWLARGPRVRVEAELVRDSLLRVSGLLTNRIGGPSVYPPQPANVTTEGAYGALSWKTSSGGDQYRRGLYTFAKRTAPYAMFATFDGPSGEACVARREVSNTPLQALTLLNDNVVLDAARALGKQVARRDAPADPAVKASEPRTSIANDWQRDADRVDWLFQVCLTRRPTDQERQLLVDYARRQRTRLATSELSAAELTGEANGDMTEQAVWTVTARAILNLDEMFTKH